MIAVRSIVTARACEAPNAWKTTVRSTSQTLSVPERDDDIIGGDFIMSQGFLPLSPKHNTMTKPSSRTRSNGAYVIRSAESRPRAVKANGAHNGRSPAISRVDKTIAKAVRQHRRAA